MSSGIVTSGPELHDSRRGELYGVFVTTYVLGAIAVALRFASRRLAGAKLWVDDWMALAALVFLSAQFGLLTYGIYRGLGVHIITLVPENSLNDLKIFYQLVLGEEAIYNGGLLFIKLSILALYWRLFHPARYMRIFLYVANPVVVAWSLALLIATLTQCIPLRGYWEKIGPDISCHVSEPRLYLAGAIIHIVADFAFLIVPIPAIWDLPRPTAQKIALIGMFLLGGFVCVVSVLRLWKLLDTSFVSADLTWSYIDIAMWSVVETNVALISACLPSLRPILMLFSTSFKTVNGSRDPHTEQNFGGYKTYYSNTDGDGSNQDIEKSPTSPTSAKLPMQSSAKESFDGFNRTSKLSTVRYSVQTYDETATKSRLESFDFGDEIKRIPSCPARVKVSPEKLKSIEAFDEDYEIFPEIPETPEERLSPYSAGVEAVRQNLRMQGFEWDYEPSYDARNLSSSKSFDEASRSSYVAPEAVENKAKHVKHDSV